MVRFYRETKKIQFEGTCQTDIRTDIRTDRQSELLTIMTPIARPEINNYCSCLSTEQRRYHKNVKMASETAFVQYNIAINVYVVGTLCVLGIAGNLLNIIVLGRDHTMHRTTGFLLQMLAVADAVYLVACVFIQTLECIVKQTDWLPSVVSRNHWPYVQVYSWPMAAMARTATVWMVVVLTVHRYIAICRPLHAAQYNTITHVRKAVAAVWIFAVVYNVPRFFEGEVVVGNVTADIRMLPNITRTNDSSMPEAVSEILSKSFVVVGQHATLQPTAMHRNPAYFLIYVTCLSFVFRFLIPFSVLAFCNHRLIHAVRASDRIRRLSAISAASGGGINDSQDTWILVVVVVVFVICQLPDVIMRVLVLFVRYVPVIHEDLSLRIMMDVIVATNMLITANSSINFVIYCLMGRRFRAILLNTVGCRGAETPTPNIQFRHGQILLNVDRNQSNERRQTV